MVPKWIQEYSKVLAEVLGSGGADVTWIMNPCPGGSERTAGYTTVEPEYCRATIELRPDIRPNLEGYNVLTHEWMHVVLVHITEAGGTVYQALPRGIARKVAKRVWSKGVERNASALASNLTPFLMAELQRRKGKGA